MKTKYIIINHNDLTYKKKSFLSCRSILHILYVDIRHLEQAKNIKTNINTKNWKVFRFLLFVEQWIETYLKYFL